jgi:hypothetical protein
MKNELLKGLVFLNTDELKTSITVVIDFCNKEKPHTSINMTMSGRRLPVTPAK